MIRVVMAVVIAVPLGLDLYIPAPEDNPLTAARIEVGRRLFHDRRLSRDQSLACASCHDPKRAFSTALPLSVGVFGRQGRRNVPALINRGYGAALKTGFNHASGDLIGFLDADGTYPPEYFPRLCEKAMNGADLVIGSRMSGEKSEMPITRRLGNLFFAGLISLLGRQRVTDSASGIEAADVLP
jgi:glycosyltransferase involved in cell wall biosynthesis